MNLIEQLKIWIDKDKTWTTSEESQLALFLQLAYDKCMNRLYPFGYTAERTLPSRYETVQVKLALYIYNLQGAEGQTSHSENGISRAFSSEEEILKAIIPFAKGV